MNFDFELILFYATVITGVLSLLDIIFLAPKRKRIKMLSGRDVKMPMIMDYARSFFPVLIIVFLLRAFTFEPFRIPSGSLEPTLLEGDFILVNKFDYGIRIPVIHKKILGSGTPQRGDIVVFRWPPNPSINFIKRVIGVPGDRISYVNKELTINGVKAPQTFVQDALVQDDPEATWKALENQEDLLGIKHHIFINPERSSRDYHDIIVPAGMYFVMGDNRDDSGDSRFWGFVPDKNIIGKASVVWLSWDKNATNVRWKRFGSVIH
jgi:signal peptidase I